MDGSLSSNIAATCPRWNVLWKCRPQCATGLLLCEFEVTLPIVVIPGAGHGVLLHFAVDHIVNRLATGSCIGFHVNSACLWIKRRLLERDWFCDVSAGCDVSRQRLAVPL